MEKKERVVGLDIVRCVAVLLIIGVHFFYNNSFYSQRQWGTEMLFADTMRWFTFSCVPLFIILTGYLKAKATVSRSYYKGIVPILITWIVVSFICIAYKVLYLHQEKTVFEWFIDIVNYKAADYAWYIELYIGIFLLCPFLNKLFDWNGTKKYHLALVITLIVVAFLPSLNLYFKVDDVQYDIIPNYLVSIWPLAYYLLGVAMHRYQPRLHPMLCMIGIYMLCVFKAMVTFLTAKGGVFTDGITGSYWDLLVMLITVLIFVMLYQLKIKKEWMANVFAHVSKRALHIYLLSSIADNIMNRVLTPYNFRDPAQYWWTFGVRIIAVFGLSLLMSELIYPITSLLTEQVIKYCFKWKERLENNDSES